MADIAHEQADKRLEELEKKFKRIYRQAEKETTEKLNDYLARFKVKDANKRALLEMGEITDTEYREWRRGQIMMGNRWKDMRDKLAKEYTNANKLAMAALNGELPEVFAEGMNYSTYDVERLSQLDTNFTLYDRETVNMLVRDNPDILPQPSVNIPKDERWNRQHIQSAVLQGIIQGESIPKVAKRLRKVTGMNKAAATRNARTAITGAENSGRVEGYKRAESLGIKMRQQWLATRDSRTRHSHAVVDGELRAVGEYFSNGCRYPGDPEAPGREVYNCRCTLVGRLDGFSTDVSQLTGKLDRLGLTYDEWKEQHREAYEREQERRKAHEEGTERG